MHAWPLLGKPELVMLETEFRENFNNIEEHSGVARKC